ncbi:hypothetical protein D3C85_1091650 [compost metagenome]
MNHRSMWLNLAVHIAACCIIPAMRTHIIQIKPLCTMQISATCRSGLVAALQHIMALVPLILQLEYRFLRQLGR